MLCWILIVGGLLIMMGQHDRSEALFYYFRLEDQVPEAHLLRLIEKHVSFVFVRDQGKIVEELNKSWEFAEKAINGMTNADFAKPLPKLGPDANAGDVVYILVADAHEHLGQSVAYARENGVVPPWTVAAKKAAEQKKGEYAKRVTTNRLRVA